MCSFFELKPFKDITINTPNNTNKNKKSIYYGWFIVLAVALAGFSQSAGTFPVLAVILDPITEEFGWSKTTFTYATSFGTIIAGIVAIFIGTALDKYGGRWILTTSVFILGLSFVLLAIVENSIQFFIILIIKP